MKCNGDVCRQHTEPVEMPMPALADYASTAGVTRLIDRENGGDPKISDADFPTIFIALDGPQAFAFAHGAHRNQRGQSELKNLITLTPLAMQ